MSTTIGSTSRPTGGLASTSNKPAEAPSSSKGLKTNPPAGIFANRVIFQTKNLGPKVAAKNNKFPASDIRHYAPAPPLTEEQVRVRDFVPFKDLLEANPHLDPKNSGASNNNKRKFNQVSPEPLHSPLLNTTDEHSLPIEATFLDNPEATIATVLD